VKQHHPFGRIAQPALADPWAQVAARLVETRLRASIAASSRRAGTLMEVADVLPGSLLVEPELDPVSVANLAQRLESLERSSTENQAILVELLEIVRAGSQPSTGEKG